MLLRQPRPLGSSCAGRTPGLYTRSIARTLTIGSRWKASRRARIAYKRTYVGCVSIASRWAIMLLFVLAGLAASGVGGWVIEPLGALALIWMFITRFPPELRWREDDARSGIGWMLPWQRWRK